MKTKTARPRPGAQTLSQQLQGIITSRGTASEVAHQAGVSASVVSRFLAGRRGLTTDTLDRIAEALGLRLVEAVAPRSRSRTRGRPRAGAGHPNPE